MGRIHIELKEGFSGNNAVIYANNEPVYSSKNLSTKPETGIADTFDINVINKPAIIRVIISDRQISQVIPLDIVNDAQIAIFLKNNMIDYKITQERLPLV
jgi:hypothetical protein